MYRYAQALAAALLAALVMPAFAQDGEGCKDHPLFNRLKNYDLSACERSDFDAFSFASGAPRAADGVPAKMVEVEGAKSVLIYNLREDGGAHASPLQAVRNYQNAVKAAGGSVEGDYQHVTTDLSGLGGGARMTTLRLTKGGKEVWTQVNAEEAGPITVTIVEREAMKQDIVANELLDKLNKDGFVALYINFDTAKATIKPDSLKIVDEVAAMLKGAPALKIEVGGHTDNVGAAEANQKLSEARAQSVAAALGQRGIAANRLAAKGYGQSAPVADNRSEEGRARNRRVELKKL